MGFGAYPLKTLAPIAAVAGLIALAASDALRDDSRAMEATAPAGGRLRRPPRRRR